MSERGIIWPQRVEAALVLLVGITLGACREFAFINLNYQIDHVAHHTSFSYAHSLVQGWTRGLDLHALTDLKWAMAVGATLLMAGLCMLLARILFGSWRLARPIMIGYLAFALFALLMHVLAGRVPPLELVFVRISHMLQYPVPLLFLLIASTLPRDMGGKEGLAE